MNTFHLHWQSASTTEVKFRPLIVGLCQKSWPEDSFFLKTDLGNGSESESCWTYDPKFLSTVHKQETTTRSHNQLTVMNHTPYSTCRWCYHMSLLQVWITWGWWHVHDLQVDDMSVDQFQVHDMLITSYPLPTDSNLHQLRAVVLSTISKLSKTSFRWFFGFQPMYAVFHIVCSRSMMISMFPHQSSSSNCTLVLFCVDS